jgi:hypothetical protein
MTPIITLYDYLDGQGFFADWESSTGSTQPKPVVQMRLLEEEAVDANKRILLIKTVSSGSGDRYTSDPVFVFAVMGKVGESAIYAEDYAELIYKSLLNFTNAGCVISIDPLGRINGAYKMDSGRTVYDMEFTVKVDSGHIGAGTL